jgi:hypothetical protein
VIVLACSLKHAGRRSKVKSVTKLIGVLVLVGAGIALTVAVDRATERFDPEAVVANMGKHSPNSLPTEFGGCLDEAHDKVTKFSGFPDTECAPGETPFSFKVNVHPLNAK